MRFMVKFACIIAVAFFASCHIKVPDLPSDEEVQSYKFCRYKDRDGDLQCVSNYKIPKEQCEKIKGKLFYDKDCTDPYKDPDPGEAED